MIILTLFIVIIFQIYISLKFWTNYRTKIIHTKISILQDSYDIFEVSRTYKNIILEELRYIYLKKFSLNF